MTLPDVYVGRHVELGWAVTGYGNQGDTVDIGLAVLEAGTTRNHAYVALTRGRHSNRAWIPDPTGTLDPADALANMIDRTHNADSALAVRQQLHRAAGSAVPEAVDASRSRTSVATPPAALEIPTETTPDVAEQIASMRSRLDRLQTSQSRTLPGIDRQVGR